MAPRLWAMTLTLLLVAVPGGARLVTQVIGPSGDGVGNILESPWDIALDSAGNAFVSSSVGPSDSVFKVEPSGAVTEYADLFAAFGAENPSGIATDAAGNVYVGTIDVGTGDVFKIDGPGSVTQIVDGFDADGLGHQLNAVMDVETDSSGNVFISGSGPSNVFKVTPGGSVTQILDETGDGVHGLSGPRGLATDAAGNLFVAGHGSDNVFKVTPGGIVTQVLDASGDGLGGTLEAPMRVATDAADNLYVTGRLSMNVFKVTPGGSVTVILDASGDGRGNTLESPDGVAVDALGNVYVADNGNSTEPGPANLFRVAPDGAVTTLLRGKGSAPDEPFVQGFAVAVNADGVPFVTGRGSDNAFRIDETCPATPLAGCRVPVEPRAVLLVKDPGKFVWKWVRGEATDFGDLGDPLADTHYSLCLYDESSGSELIFELTAPAARQCGARPCWRTVAGKGLLKYTNRASLPDGLRLVKVLAGAEGRAKALVKGKGPDLLGPPLPLALPVRAQLQGSNGACLEAVFDAPDVVRNDGTLFKAKGGAD